MPIVNVKPTVAPVGEVPSLNKIFEPEFKSNVVDTSFNPISSLITFIEGSAWTVDYYSQVIDKSNALSGQDTAQSAVYQQYRVIRRFVIKVVNSLNWSQDNTSKAMEVSGSGHIHSMVIPNEGDMFLADVGDGREGVFQITLSEKKSLLKESVYFIEYRLIYFTDTNKEKRQNLESKVVQEVFYNKDFLEHGQNPLLVKTDYEAVTVLKSKYGEMIDHYFRWFFSSEFKTLIVPGQPYVVYDPFVVKFVSSILNTDDNEFIRHMKNLNVDDDYMLKEPQIYSAIFTKDKLALKTCSKKMGTVGVKQFNSDPLLAGIRYSGVKSVIYPINRESVYSATHNRFVKTASETFLTHVDTSGGNLETIIPNNDLTIGDLEVPGINSVLKDDYYVFSENFYEDTLGKSGLEIMVLNYFDSKANNPIELLKLVDNYHNWGGLERFYYIPILLAMIKSIIRGL